MKKLLPVLLTLVLVSLVFASTVRTIDGTRRYRKADISADRTEVPFYAGGRQDVLFVMDGGGLGPDTTTDIFWTAVLDSLLGVGNYGWFGPTTAYDEDGPDLTTMQAYALVIWNTYDSWNPAAGMALTATDQSNIADYLTGGGKVWLIGQDVIYSGVPLSFMSDNFDVASVEEDYEGGFPKYVPHPVTGLIELDGYAFSFTVDSIYSWGSDVYPDNLTPSGSAHRIIQDTDFPTNYPCIIRDDYTSSFWTIDGRDPAPWADWQAIVDMMFTLFGITGVSEMPSQTPVGKLQLTIAPAPVVTAATINYTLPIADNVRLQVYNKLGQHVTTLVDAHTPAGSYKVTWNGTDARGTDVPNGVYFVRLTSGGYSTAANVVVVR